MDTTEHKTNELNTAGHIANAEPTKSFFIDMLVRDIPLQRAIIDVIDNSIDAAIVNSGGNPDLHGYSIDIIITEEKFVIIDNCGGMSRKTAQDDAFTFGRFSSKPVDTSSKIGNFGVGMKRTIFKLGKYFRFFSCYQGDNFFIEQDIDKWIDQQGKWQFEIKDGCAYPKQPDDWEGVIIEVLRLNDNVKSDFKITQYIRELSNEIGMFLSHYINRGVSISINNDPLKATDIKLFNDDIFCPFKYTYELIPPKSPDKTPVLITISIGLGARGKWDGGWYIFCNNRMIVKADQTEATGWGKEKALGKKYHENFAYFRGIVSFESKNGDLLPWTTTKTGINRDNDIYKNALSKMSIQAIPILEFLDNVALQKSKYSTLKRQQDYDGELDDFMSFGEMLDDSAQKELLSPINIERYTTTITIPQLEQPIVSTKPTVSIQYSVDRNLATSVKKLIQGSSFSNAGYLVFMDYALANNLLESSDDE
jgi:hypothetical protein